MPKARICYCRFFSSSVGLKFPADSIQAARTRFARYMGVPETSSYIVASFKPAPGILFTDLLQE